MSDKKVRLTLAQGSEDYLKLLNYVIEQPDGAMLEYNGVHADTGVKMDKCGRDKLRRAIRRSRREYSAKPSQGYVLAEPLTVTGILAFRLARVDGQVKRAEQAHEVLQERFYDQLGEPQQRTILLLGAIFGAIRLSAENGKKLWGQDVKQISNTGDSIKDTLEASLKSAETIVKAPSRRKISNAS